MSSMHLPRPTLDMIDSRVWVEPDFANLVFSALLPPSVLIWQGGKAGRVKTEAKVLTTDQKSQEEGIPS